MNAALVLDDVSFAIGGARLTDSVSLSIAAGERVALVGPNGAGKTTIINLVSGIYRPSAGRIVLDGTEITDWSTHRRARAGLARTFQITDLLASCTVEENLATAVGSRHRLRGNPFRPWRSILSIWDKVDELICASGLDAVRTTPVGDLPYGDQRKLEIVVAVARPASVVLLDEPGAGLTAEEAESLLDLVFRLGDDLAVLFVDHDLGLVQRLATRMVLLDLGRVVGDGLPADVVASDRFREIYAVERRDARG